MGKMKDLLVTMIATAFGSGFTPKAPGTAGTMVAVGIVYLVKDWDFQSYSLLWIAIFISGWWASLEWSRKRKVKDSQQIVVDEVLGYMISMAMLPRTATVLLVQFILFRIFDALKPPPIRQLDQWGKKFEIGPIQSLGVILDDLLAGIITLGAFYLIHSFTKLY